MDSPKRPPLLVRIATLTVALGALSALVAHASLSAGCTTPAAGSPVASAEVLVASTSGAASPGIPSSPVPAPDRAATAPGPTAPGATSAAPAAKAARKPRYDVSFPATKAAPVFRPEEDEQAADQGAGQKR
jgi:hypothetical protein